ncbi:ABC transporter substrate binding protein [Ramlibacter sp. 2FC]|uniref:ABC transporter substrate binding protein n=1 Tax=Ramlibacter sp. 2FC TaxID=2502188 RepID=UPI0010F695E2|nr:ABC transporter substrate binding protein [Ramlibacter sp. 2FC]
MLAGSLAATLLPQGRAWGADPTLWLALTEPGGAYAEAAAALREDWAAAPRRAELLIAPARELLALASAPPRLVVSLGAGALRAVVDRMQNDAALARVPLLASLLPRASYEAVVGHRMPASASAVLLDQPLDRHFELLRQALPTRRKVGMLLGPDTVPLRPALLAAAAARGMQLNALALPSASQDLYPALREVLDDSEVLLTLPDSLLLQPGALQNLLIAAYRQRVPVATYSAAQVKAGATLALFTSPAQAARQTSAAMQAFLAGRGLPPVRLAESFSVAVNAQVGRSLGLALDDANTLAAAVRRQEVAR